MKPLLLFLGVIVISNNTYAQCTMPIAPSPGHVKITSNQTLAATGTIYWICDGVDLIVSSSPGSLFLLEANATITFNGSAGDQVYAKAGCVITNNTGQDIGVGVNPGNVTLTNTGGGTITITDTCAVVTYDYSLVGGTSGCMTSTVEIDENEVVVYPNPFSDIIYFSVPVKGSYRIHDVSGKMVVTGELNNENYVTTTYLNTGVYFLYLEDRIFKLVK